MLAEDLIRLRCEGESCAGGHIIQNDGKVGLVGQVFIVVNQTALGGLIIIRGHQQQRIRARLLGMLAEIEGRFGAVAA